MRFKKILKGAIPMAVLSAAVGVGIATNINTNQTNAPNTSIKVMSEEVVETVDEAPEGVNLPTVDLSVVKTSAIDIYKSTESIMLNQDVQAVFERYLTDLKINLSDITIKSVSDNYTGSGSVVGNYGIIYKINDLAESNDKNIGINIHVVNNIPNIYMSTNSDTGLKQIVVKDNLTLNNKDISSILQTFGEISGAAGTFEAVYTSKYFSSPKKIGTYTLSYEVEETSGNSSKGELEIKVISSTEASDSGSFGAKTKRFFSKIGKFFKKIGKAIAKPFVWIYKNTIARLIKLFK